MDAEMRRRNFELLACYKRELKGFEDAYIVPVDFSNVLACGLCISVEEDYVKTIRMQPNCLISGQVAGTAAALALDAAKGDVGAVPYAELRKRLESQNHRVDGVW